MKKMIVLLFALLMSCGSEEGSSIRDRWSSWVEREDFTSEEVRAQSTLEEEVTTLRVVASLHQYPYKYDTVDYWKASWETERDGYGDCEDIAILAYVLLLKNGVNPDHMYLALIGQDEVNHCILIVNGVHYFAPDCGYTIFYTFTKDYCVRQG
jgi:hypothetical protein